MRTLVAIAIVAAVAVVVVGCPGASTGGPDRAPSFVKGMSWQITLSEPPASRTHDVDAWDLDMEDTPADVVKAIHDGGTLVICYFSAGTFEPFRSDADVFTPDVKGNAYDDPEFAEELYLDVNNPAVLAIMKTRLDGARDKGCDAVDPDNVDLDQHDTGFTITAEDMLAYNEAIVDEAHARGMRVGLKNDLAQLPQLGPLYDFFVNEQCIEFDECDAYARVLDDNKPVLNIEYDGDLAHICEVSKGLGLSTLKKNLDLDDALETCP